MSNGNGHRWSKFFWADHQGDEGLRVCGLAARGYWIEMLAVMHKATAIGQLLINGRPATHRQMAVIAGCTEKEARTLEAELEAAGVFSRTTDGCIYSRRMVNDTAAHEQARAWGSGGGNPSLKAKPNGADPPPKHRGGVNPPLNPGGYPPPYPTPLTPGVNPPVNPACPPLSGLSPQEAEIEPEEEERERVSKIKHLPSSSPVLARVAAACETPPAGSYGADPDEPAAVTVLGLATKNLVGKVARKLATSADKPLGKRPALSVVEQIDAVLRGPVVDDEDGAAPWEGPPIRRPLEPQRTVAEQLAALGYPEMAAGAPP